jgi:hypothetical protein
MLFDSDWNWIMEVVEKIQTLDKLGGIVLIQQGRCKITSRMAGDNTVYADVSNYFLQGIKGHEHDCGRPGINGGYFDNPEMRFGVNCFGAKPNENEADARNIMSQNNNLTPD